jgi:hypothetical protein
MPYPYKKTLQCSFFSWKGHQMNIQDIGRLYESKTAIGDALSGEDQNFVSDHYPDIVKFMRSDDGKKAINSFVNSWKLSIK